MDEVKQEIVALLPRLRRFAWTLTGSAEEGDDLVQATCERALSRLDQWRPGTHLDRWLMRIAHTVWIDRVRQRSRREVPEDPDTWSELPGLDGRDVVEARLTLESVRRIVSRLPEEQRSVVALVTIEGLSYREAAEALDVPVGTVMSRLARARGRIADALAGPVQAEGQNGAMP